MSASAPWFKFYPADFMHGVRGLSAQEIGVYTMILCRIYEESGRVEYNALRLATYCGMRQPTFVKTIQKLVDLGKLTIEDGMIWNARAEMEISNRANDLKNSSTGGKVSAQKRQQKQRETASGLASDQQATASHTDTDTDIDIGGGGSAGAREADHQPPTDRERILAAMGVGPDGIIGAGKFTGTQGDMAEVARWLALPGINIDVICDEVGRVCRAKRDGPPFRFSYFTEAIQRLSGQISAPPLSPTAPAARAFPSASRQPSAAEMMAILAPKGPPL